MIDVKARTENNEIPTDWSSVTGDVSVSPVVKAVEAWKAPQMLATEAQRRREENLQLAAYNMTAPIEDWKQVRDTAASEYIGNIENLSIDAAIEANKLGVSPNIVLPSVAGGEYKRFLDAKNYALETIAAERQRQEAIADNEELESVEVNWENTGLNDFASMAAKGNILKGFAERSPKELDADAFEYGAWLAARFIPGVEWYKNISVSPDGIKQHWSTLGTRQAQRDYIFGAMEEMNEEQFYAFCTFLDQSIRGQTTDPIAIEDFWKAMAEGGGALADVFAVFDFLQVGKLARAIATRYAGPAKGLSEAAKAGNINKVKEEFVDLSHRLRNEQEDVKLLTDMTQTAMKAQPDVMSTSTATTLVDEIDDAISKESAIKEFKNLYKPMAMDEEQAKRQLEKFSEKIRNAYFRGPKKQKILDYTAIGTELNERGMWDAVVSIGTGSDGTARFVNEKAALDFIKNNTNFPEGTVKAIPDGNGWKVVARVSIPEQGEVIRNGKDAWEVTKAWKANALSRTFGDRIFVPDNIHSIDAMTLRSTTKGREILDENYLNKITALSQDEYKQLDAIWKNGVNENVEFSHQYLKDVMHANDKVIEAYDAAQSMSKLNGIVTNDELYKTLVKEGNYDIIAKKQHYLGQIIDDIPETSYPKTTFKDVSTGKVYDFGELKRDQFKELVKNKDYVMVRLRAPALEIIDDELTIPVQHLIGPRESLKQRLLPRMVMGWEPGGHRWYNPDMWYAKQPFVYNRGDMTYLGYPSAVFGEMDKAVGEKWVKEINDALAIYREHKYNGISRVETSGRLNEATAGNQYFRVSSVEDLEKYLRSKTNPNGKLDWREDLELVKSGQELKRVAKLKAQGAIQVTNTSGDDINDLVDMMTVNSKGYWMRGKEPLKTFDGTPLPLLDVAGVTQRNINQIIDMGMKKARTQYYAREFRELFGDVIDPSDLKHLTDDELLRAGRLKTPVRGEDPSKYQAALNMQKHYQRQVGVKTNWDLWWEHSMEAAASAIGDSKLGKAFDIFQPGSKGREALRNIEPMKLGKALAYQHSFGFFNIGQFWKQANGAMQVMYISPKWGSKVLSRIPSLFQAISAKTEAQIADAVRALKFDKVLTDKEARGLVDFLRRTQTVNAQDLLSTYQALPNLRGLSDLSTLPARYGENVNSIAAYSTAYLEWIAKNPQKTLDAAAAREVFSRAEDLYLNMSRISQSEFQVYPVTRMISQYSAFPIRCLEAVLGKHLTRTERAQLAVGNLLMSGVRGAFGTGGLLAAAGFGGFNLYNFMEDQVGPFAADAVINGTFDAILHELGVSSSLGSSLGPGVGEFGAFNAVIEAITEDQINLANAIPSWRAIKDIVGVPCALMDVFKAVMAFVNPGEMDDEEVLSHIYDLATEDAPTQLNRFGQAAYILATNRAINKAGRLVKENADPWDALGVVLGIPMSEADVTSYLYDGVKSSNEKIKGLADDLAKDYRKFVATGSKSALQKYLDRNMLFRSTLTFDEQIKLSKANTTNIRKANRPGTISQQVFQDYFGWGKNKTIGMEDTMKTLRNPQVREVLK